MSRKHIFLEEPLFEVVDCLCFITMSDGGVGIEAYFHEMSDDGVGAEVDFHEYVRNCF